MKPNKPTERVLKVVNNGIYEWRVVEREQLPADWKAIQQSLCDAIASDAMFLDHIRSVANARFDTTFEALEQLWYRHGDKPKERRPKK